MAELFCWLTAHRKGRALGPERRWGGGDFSAYLQKIKKGSPCAELFSQNSSALSTACCSLGTRRDFRLRR